MGVSLTENKIDSKSQLNAINEIADLYNCNNCIFFETRKRRDLFMWFSKAPQGPSMKCYVQNGPWRVLVVLGRAWGLRWACIGARRPA